MYTLKIVLLGAVTGVLSGLFGVGGGVLLVPALVYLYGMSQHRAQGTSLAVLLLPIGLPGVLNYYKDGNVDLEMAAYLVLGFLAGITLTSHLVSLIPEVPLRRAFGGFLLLVSLRMIFQS